MRTDEQLDPELNQSEAWKSTTSLQFADDPINQSFSGNERNRWYINHEGKQGRMFSDFSTLSGMDSESDGRGFVIWDYNHDGRPDIALCNANAPHLNMYKNNISSGNRFVAIRFVGGATDSPSRKGFSNRDGYGSVVTIHLNDGTRIEREFRCGEGFASQNSDTMIIGIGQSVSAEKIDIRWSSGRTYSATDVPAGKLVTFEEEKAGVPTHTVNDY